MTLLKNMFLSLFKAPKLGVFLNAQMTRWATAKLLLPHVVRAGWLVQAPSKLQH